MMNKNHELLINNLIPVLWNPGHMGAFFGRFLHDDVYVAGNADLLPPAIKDFNTVNPNFEWRWYDCIANYFLYSTDDKNNRLYDTIEILKKYYSGADLDSAMIYVTALHYNGLYDRVIDFYWKNEYSETELVDMVNKPYDFSTFQFPYVAGHQSSNLGRINKLKWKKKILCRFPHEKSWIPLFLKFYKHYWFYKKNNTEIKISDSFQEAEGEQFRKIIKNEIYFNYRPENRTYALDDFIIVDMYDLIFNQNTDALKQIDSCFENPLSNTRLDLLAGARKHIIEILSEFGLNHEINVDKFTTDLLTPKVIEVCDYIKNNKA